MTAAELESPRFGRRCQARGRAAIALAVVLAAGDLLTGQPWWLTAVNILTFLMGVRMIRTGRMAVRQAAAHRKFMASMRQKERAIWS